MEVFPEVGFSDLAWVFLLSNFRFTPAADSHFENTNHTKNQCFEKNAQVIFTVQYVSL